MRTMKLKNLFAITMILSSICVIAAFSGAANDRSINEGTENFRSSEYLQKRTFLFGSIKNLNVEGDYSTVEPVNLRVIFFKPFQLFHDTTGGPITFLNQDRGIILADSFLLGRFTVVLPINTNSIAVMNTTLGTIIIELYEDKMPITSENFIKLANDGFYNGLVFHRVIEDFVIQGEGTTQTGLKKSAPMALLTLK